MHLAYICLKEGENEPENESWYDKAAEYYQEARNIYQQSGTPEDSGMEELEDYMEQRRNFNG